ncbi:hypothetical protein DAEQUDRAFT_532447 [Daedalea quercina L-15889]|uniref:Secreted protein n=1 Tax=Daedalea quercina L-15889 TaxID=1314783 RepID=A0A165M6I9_9APHY|nr:hypothetical protein DAEQUDRAFT_532447 [Daedalea quercina L-15889]
MRVITRVLVLVEICSFMFDTETALPMSITIGHRTARGTGPGRPTRGRFVQIYTVISTWARSKGDYVPTPSHIYGDS